LFLNLNHGEILRFAQNDGKLGYRWIEKLFQGPAVRMIDVSSLQRIRVSPVKLFGSLLPTPDFKIAEATLTEAAKQIGEERPPQCEGSASWMTSGVA
jgi:hypothetical protein